MRVELPGKQEVDVAVAFEAEAEVVRVLRAEGIGLDRRGLDDVLEHVPVAHFLQDASGDELHAGVKDALAFSNLTEKNIKQRYKRNKKLK